jgi:hypothetical protein
MTQDLETMLRKSLDEVDRSIKIQQATCLLLSIIVVAGLLWLRLLSETADVKTMLLISVSLLLSGQVATLVSCNHLVATMTRKTLKAIELLSKE